MLLSLLAGVVTVIGGLLVSLPLSAQSLNIDLGTSVVESGPPSSSFGGAASQPGVWSRLGNGTTASLPDLTGAPTAVSATVTSDDPTGELNTCTGDLGHLLNDFVYSSATWSVVLNGLANGTYTVYLYEPENDAVVTGAMTVNGTPVAGLTAHTCALNPGEMFTTATVKVTTGTLTITGTNEPPFAGLAGIQLVTAKAKTGGQTTSMIPTVSPAALVLLAVVLGAGAAASLRRWRRG
jgi:hypothetical protein